MTGCRTLGQAIRHVQPIWSTSRDEARSRVIKLYKTWYRQIPHIVDDYNLPRTTSQCRAKLHAEFTKQKHIKDIRQIDTLVIRHQVELKEICCMQKKRSYLLSYVASDDGETIHRTEFLSKFLVGQN